MKISIKNTYRYDEIECLFWLFQTIKSSLKSIGESGTPWAGIFHHCTFTYWNFTRSDTHFCGENLDNEFHQKLNYSKTTKLSFPSHRPNESKIHELQ